jgi:hypothetical protein
LVRPRIVDGLVGGEKIEGVFDEFGEEVGEVGGGGAHDGGGSTPRTVTRW